VSMRERMDFSRMLKRLWSASNLGPLPRSFAYVRRIGYDVGLRELRLL
jgi:hypothetical protein